MCPSKQHKLSGAYIVRFRLRECRTRITAPPALIVVDARNGEVGVFRGHVDRISDWREEILHNRRLVCFVFGDNPVVVGYRSLIGLECTGPSSWGDEVTAVGAFDVDVETFWRILFA